MTKHHYRLLIAYDGSNYGGWQVQPNALSIQELIQTTLSKILRIPTNVTGSGRTDAGVHAFGQVAHFSHQEPIDLKKLALSLNGLLPPDIRIRSISEVDSNFHARYSAKGKIYHYHIHLDPIHSPFSKMYRYHVPHPVNLELLAQAATLFVGTHDFTSFSNQAHRGSAAHDPIRTISRIEIVPQDGGVRLEFEGNGFLYKMVRNIVGTLLEVSNGKIPLEKIPEIFAAKNRSQAGTTAPPHGLFLFEVKY